MGDCRIRLDTLKEKITESKDQFTTPHKQQAFVTTVIGTTQHIIDNAAEHHYGKISKRFGSKLFLSQSDKEGRLKEFRELEYNLRYTIKTIQNMLKTLKSDAQNKNKTNRQLIELYDTKIINMVGKEQYEKYIQYIIDQKRYKQFCKQKKREKQEKENEKTITQYKSKSWYDMVKKIGKPKQKRNENITRIIKTKYACKKIPQTLKNKLTHKHFTKTNQETADEIVEYMGTLGSEHNPAFNPNIRKSRTLAREFDKPYDFKPKIWHETIPENHQTQQQIQKWLKALQKLNAMPTFAEIRRAVYQCKNNKAFHGTTHIIFIKQMLDDLLPILQFIFYWWAQNGIITNNLNQRLMNPTFKSGKDDRLVGALRPVEFGYILMKIYSIIYTNKYKIYIYELQIMSYNQFSGKKASGSEDCIINIITDIDTQLHDAFPTKYATVDESDAFNSMDTLIIRDKMVHHCGFDNQAMVTFGSLTYGVTSICKLMDTKSKVFKPIHFFRKDFIHQT